MTRPFLVFGAGGRVGKTLQEIASKLPGDFVFSDRESGGFDLTDSNPVGWIIEEIAPAAIINLAACTLPYAEKPEARDEATAVNLNAVRELAAFGVPVVHISTDCVFDGTATEPYAPNATPAPINWYGATKWGGEAWLNSYGGHIIIRTTGVYLADKPNFLKLVLDKARAGEELTVVSDSIYTPTDARELAKAILLATERVIEDPSVSGTYHFAGPDVMSYIDFADLVLEEAGLSMPVHATTMAEREAIEGFKRPKNAALNSDLFAETFGLRHRPTRECVRELVNPAQ